MVLESQKKKALIAFLASIKNANMSMSLESLKDEQLQEVLSTKETLESFDNLTMPIFVSSMGIVENEPTYNKFCPIDYVKQYPYSKEYNVETYPWLAVQFNKVKTGTDKIAVSVYKDGKICTINSDSVSSLGTLKDNTILVLTDANKKYIMFELVKDLNIPISNLRGKYTICFQKSDDASGTTLTEPQYFEIEY